MKNISKAEMETIGKTELPESQNAATKQ